jgi:hypothetical protein
MVVGWDAGAGGGGGIMPGAFDTTVSPVGPVLSGV